MNKIQHFFYKHKTSLNTPVLILTSLFITIPYSFSIYLSLPFISSILPEIPTFVFVSGILWISISLVWVMSLNLKVCDFICAYLLSCSYEEYIYGLDETLSNSNIISFKN